MPLTIALRSLQREIIRSDPDWNGGATAMTANRCPECRWRASSGWCLIAPPTNGIRSSIAAACPESERVGKRFEREFEIENYLEYNAQKFIHSFDPNSYLYLSRAMDWFDIAEHGDSIADGMARVSMSSARW